MTVFVDAAGGTIGGGARFRVELYRYLDRTKRQDVKVIGVNRQIDPAWLLRREIGRPTKGRIIALNNVSFVTPGGERWTRLGNPLDFLTDDEWSSLHPSLKSGTRLRAPIVRLAARRSDVIVTPSAGMAERVAHVLPALRDRIIPRLNPVSADSIPQMPREAIILCPVLFAPYKHMIARLTELLAAIDDYGDPAIRLIVTADESEITPSLACHPRVNLVGRISHSELRQPLGAQSRDLLPQRDRVIRLPASRSESQRPASHRARNHAEPGSRRTCAVRLYRRRR